MIDLIEKHKYLLFGRYYAGLVVFLIISIIGMWILLRGLKGEDSFLDGLLKLPGWLVVMIGILLQMPTIGYVYLGIRAGAF
jgi:hypothetical protein